MWAILKGHEGIALEILKQKINQKCVQILLNLSIFKIMKDNTALMWAIVKGDEDIAIEILKHPRCRYQSSR